jgi:hypothetical protein
MDELEAWSNFRENAAGRINTYMGGLAQGGGNRRVAERMATRHHFDYGNLTTFEQKVRNNFMPFYTWNARNLPLWTAALWERPGMIANFQMARQEAAQASGIDPNYEQKLGLTEQNTFPIPVNLPKNTPFGLGGMSTVSLGSGGASIGSLNFSVGAAITGLLPGNDVEYHNGLKDFVFGLLNPAVKVPLELTTGYSFYLHGQIKPPSHQLTQAPGWTKQFKDMPGFKALFGWVPDYYDKNGTKSNIPGWSTEMDYLMSQAPGIFGLLMKSGKKQSNNPLSYVDPSRSLLSFATGVRLRKYDPYANEYRLLLQTRKRIEDELGKMRQQKNKEKDAILYNERITADNPTRAFDAATELLHNVEDAIAAHEDYFKIPRSSGGGSSSSKSSSGWGNSSWGNSWGGNSWGSNWGGG